MGDATVSEPSGHLLDDLKGLQGIGKGGGPDGDGTCVRHHEFDHVFLVVIIITPLPALEP